MAVSSKIRDKICSERNSMIDRCIIGYKEISYTYSSGKVFNRILGYSIPEKFKYILNKILDRGFKGIDDD